MAQDGSRWLKMCINMAQDGSSWLKIWLKMAQDMAQYMAQYGSSGERLKMCIKIRLKMAQAVSGSRWLKMAQDGSIYVSIYGSIWLKIWLKMAQDGSMYGSSGERLQMAQAMLDARMSGERLKMAQDGSSWGSKWLKFDEA